MFFPSSRLKVKVRKQRSASVGLEVLEARLPPGDILFGLALGSVWLRPDNLILRFNPPIGSSYEILTTADPSGITGTFAGLDEGAILSQGDYQFQITYQGGANGTSVVLMRVA